MTTLTEKRTIDQIKAQFEATVRRFADVEVALTATQFSVCGAKAEVAKAVESLAGTDAWELTSLITYEDDPDMPTFTVAVFKHA